tara:strand:- start:1719 stop:2690 length:972 start_codon:yes stop_codon:yes gene_type:complete
VEKLNKYELRYLINEEAQLMHHHTMYRMDPLDEGILDTAIEGIKSLGTSIALAIPGLDAYVGQALTGQKILAITKAINEMGTSIGGSNNILEHIASGGPEWQNTLRDIQSLPEKLRDKLRGHFNELLKMVKDLVMILLQTYDSIIAGPLAAAAGAATAGLGAAAVEAITNALTAGAAFVAKITDPEQIIFGLGSKIAGYLDKIFDFLHGESRSGIVRGADAGDNFMKILISNPFEAFSRLGQIYDALHNPGVNVFTDVKHGVKDAAMNYAKQKSGLDFGNFGANDDFELTDDMMVAESRKRKLNNHLGPVLNESRMLKLAGIK